MDNIGMLANSAGQGRVVQDTVGFASFDAAVVGFPIVSRCSSDGLYSLSEEQQIGGRVVLCGCRRAAGSFSGNSEPIDVLA